MEFTSGQAGSGYFLYDFIHDISPRHVLVRFSRYKIGVRQKSAPIVMIAFKSSETLTITFLFRVKRNSPKSFLLVVSLGTQLRYP